MALLQNVVQRGLGMQPNTSGHSKSLRARARYVLHDDDGDGDDDDDDEGGDDESLRAVSWEFFVHPLGLNIRPLCQQAKPMTTRQLAIASRRTFSL